MSGTTINISGNSNDTNLVLGSANASISDNASASVPIDSINPPVTLKINNTYWGSGSYEYEKLLEFINRVDKSSGGMIKMELVGNTGASAIPELFPKLQSGEYDGFVLPTKALTDFFQKNKVYELIGEPAAGAGLGYDYTLFSSWLETGGGYELLDQVTASDNFKMFPIMNVSPEGGGWFSKQISSLADLTSTTNQVVYRSPGGTVGRAYQAIDISVNLTLGSTSDVVAGFESGIINAGEWAGIFPDVCFNFHTYAPYAMVGGVHQNIAITTFNLSTAALAKLTSSQQELIKNLCRDEFNNTPGKRIEKNGKLLKNLVDAGSVTLMETPQDFIDAFRSAVKTIYESDKSGNTLFTTVYNSLETFMENNKDFRRLELDAMAKLSRSPVQNVPNTVLAGRMFLGGNLLFYFTSATQMVRLRINPDVSYSTSDLNNRNWWLNPMNGIVDFVYNFDSAVYDASQNVHLKGSETTPHPIAGNSITYEHFQWVNTIIDENSLTVPLGDMLLNRDPIAEITVLPEIDPPISIHIGFNSWKFPELETKLAMIAGSQAGVADSDGQIWTQDQITTATRLENYYVEVDILDLNFGAWDPSVNWLVEPSGVGVWDGNYFSVGTGSYKKSTLNGIKKTWFSNEYYNNIRLDRIQAYPSVYNTHNGIGAFGAPLYLGEKRKTNFENFGNGVNLLCMYYEVLNEISYNTWKQSVITNLDASMHLLVDSKIGDDTNDAYVAEGNLFAINHRVLVIELLHSTNPDNEASTFYNSNLPNGVNMKMVWVVTGYT